MNPLANPSLRTKKAAEFLDMKEKRFNLYVKAGKIPYIDTKPRTFELSDLMKWRDDNKKVMR